MEDEDDTEIPMTRVMLEMPEEKAEMLIEIMKMYCTQITQIE